MSQCDLFLGAEEIDAGDRTFPSEIPSELLPFYTLGGTVEIQKWRQGILKSPYLEGRTLTWSKEHIEELVSQAEKRALGGTYGLGATNALIDKVAQLPVKGSRVLVIGTEFPWAEAVMLSLGAAHVVTLEYAPIVSHHEKVSAYTPSQLREAYNSNQIELFDIVVSHSSLEHSGLGRYGDALNPWGDMLATARAWCVTKPKGYMYLGLPTSLDGIQYNAHRNYGALRWPLVSTNWKPMVPADKSTIVLSDGSELQKPIGADIFGFGYLFQKVVT